MLDAGTAGRRTAVTDDQGRYAFNLLRVGQYELQIDLAGFRSYRRKGVVIDVNRALDVDATLVAARPAENGAGILLCLLVALLAVRLLRASRS